MMNNYIQYYGLSENPFDISPNSKFFFLSESHKEALASLLYVIKERKGFMLLVGENGGGKTVLINHLMELLEKNVNVVYFPHGNLSFEQIIKQLLIKLELPIKKTTKGSMVHQLNGYLIHNLTLGKNLILIIDEAQGISSDVLEELRLTSNLETNTSKLLQIIFVGLPKLETKLNTKGLRQLKQRIGIISRITRLSQAESIKYIDNRLQLVGSHSDAIFSPQALALICKYAAGVPLKINMLCHNALFRGFERSEKQVSVATVRKIRNKQNLSTDKHMKVISNRDKLKSHFISIQQTTWFKRSLYFCLAAGCIMLAVLIGKYYPDNIPEVPQPSVYLKPSAVSKKITTKTPVTEEVISKIPVVKADLAPEIAPAASSGNNLSINPSELADIPTQSVLSAKTEIRYKKIVDIGSGDTLRSLILYNYNQVNATLMDFIMEVNPEITDPDLILINSKIRLPEITEQNLVTQSSDGSIKAHLGTFPTRHEAINYKIFINITDKEIEIIPRKISADIIWFRIMAGPFTNQEDCLKTIQNLNQRGLLPAFRKIPKI